MVKLPSNGMTVVDFFCGAGVGAIGTELAGFETIFAFDNNKHAVRTYNYNLKNKVAKVLDANSIDFQDIPYADIYTGGFPCQPFSISGKNLGVNDPEKGNLGMLFSKMIVAKRPKGFLMENVSGISNKRNIDFLKSLVLCLSQDYNVHWGKYNLVEYGVPQDRVRVFIIGVRKDLGTSFEFPTKSLERYTIRDAIGDLPKVPDNFNNHYNLSKYKLRNDEKPYSHKILPGQNWKSLPIEDQKAFMKGAFNSPGGKTSFLRKVDPDKPAKTIISTPMGKATSQILDWGIGDDRRYTVRESLRLQTVPDWFSFPDDVPHSVQYERCSGIPSLVSYKLMINLQKAIKR